MHKKSPVLDLSLIKLQVFQVFSCEYCEISKNSYFENHVRTVASIYFRQRLLHCFFVNFELFPLNIIDID